MVGIVILNYNNSKDLSRCIDSIITYEELNNYKLMIVDNGSSENDRLATHSYLKTRFGKYNVVNGAEDMCHLASINYLSINKNIGYARGNNEGIKCFFRDQDVNYIMVLNSDIIFTQKIISPLRKIIDSKSNCGVISPLLYNKNGGIDYCCARQNYDTVDISLTFSFLLSSYYRKRVNKKKLLLQTPELLNSDTVDIELPSGSCMLFKKNVMEMIGGFDPNTFLYYEESILYEKLKSIGLRSYLLTTVSCIHLGGASTTTTKSAYFLKLCNYNSLMYYVNNYRSLPYINKIYMIITGKIRLFRLWLALILKSLI